MSVIIGYTDAVRNACTALYSELYIIIYKKFRNMMMLHLLMTAQNKPMRITYYPQAMP